MPNSPCKCPNFAKLADKHWAQLASNHKSGSNQDKQGTTDDNIPITIRKMQAQAQKWPRKQKTHRKINVRSDLSDSDDGKDNQARGKPVVDIISDHKMDIDQQPSNSIPSTSTPLKRPNTYPKVLSLGRGRGKFPLANWTSVTKGGGCRLLSGCDIPKAPPVHPEPVVERNLAIVAPTHRIQTYKEI